MSTFKIHFSGRNHGCGCGCYDNDLNIADKSVDKDFSYSGTREEAEKELERLKAIHQNYGRDWGNWTLTEEKNTSRLVVISGPSGVGKGPIIEWARKLYLPDLCQVKVRKTKTERHVGTEDDLGFDRNDGRYYQFECRGAEQRIYLDELDAAIEKHDVVLLEAYYNTLDFLKSRYGTSIDFASTFVSPLDAEDINDLAEQGKKIEEYLPNLMLDSLVRRAERDGKVFTRALTRELEQRAEDSVDEIRSAHNYQQVIPNHCYESDSRWRYALLIGEPKKVVISLRDIVNTGWSDHASPGQDFLI